MLVDTGRNTGQGRCSPPRLGKTSPVETQETGEGGVVSASPLPVSPSPTGVIPHRYTAREVIPSSHGFRRENSPKILPPPLGTATGAIARHCPPPLEGAGGGRVSGRVVGVFLPHTEKSVRLKRKRQERGESSPPPPSPSAPPPRGDSPSIHCPGRASPQLVSGEKLPEDPASTSWHGHRSNHQTLPAPCEGAGGGRGAAGRWG